MLKISVIIPAYNTQLYLDECLNSVINQTYKDIEIICIDDNSEDSSIDIIRAYKKKDTRISIVELNQNSGPGHARNQGLNVATGDYTVFLDSDDYLDIHILDIAVASGKLLDVDILVFNGEAFDHKTSRIHSKKYHYLEERFFKDKYIEDRYLLHLADFHSPCMKIFKTSFLRKNNILFPVAIIGEDVEFWMRCMLNMDKIDYIDFTGYYRRYREGSIMTSNIRKNLRDRISNLDSLLSICSHHVNIYNYIVGIYIPSIMQKVHDTQDIELINYAQESYNYLINKYDE